jgi:hypothetical protein
VKYFRLAGRNVVGGQSVVDIFLFLEMLKMEWMKLPIRPRTTCRPNFLRPPISPINAADDGTKPVKKKKGKPGEDEEGDLCEMNLWLSMSKNAANSIQTWADDQRHHL